MTGTTVVISDGVEGRRSTEYSLAIPTQRIATGTPSSYGFEGAGFPGGQSLLLDARRLLTGILDRMLATSLTPITPMDVSVDQLLADVAGIPSSPGEITAADASYALMELLNVNMETLGRWTGIGRTTFIYWKKTGAVPRPSTARNLWRLYGLAVGLKPVLGIAGIRSWLGAGTPSPTAMLEQGDLAGFEHLVFRQMMGRPRNVMMEPGAATDDEIPFLVPALGPARGSRGSARRGRIG